MSLSGQTVPVNELNELTCSGQNVSLARIFKHIKTKCQSTPSEVTKKHANCVNNKICIISTSIFPHLKMPPNSPVKTLTLPITQAELNIYRMQNVNSHMNFDTVNVHGRSVHVDKKQTCLSTLTPSNLTQCYSMMNVTRCRMWPYEECDTMHSVTLNRLMVPVSSCRG